MWRKYKNWIELIKFIRLNREAGVASFEVLTTSDKIIVLPSERFAEAPVKRLEIKY